MRRAILTTAILATGFLVYASEPARAQGPPHRGRAEGPRWELTIGLGGVRGNPWQGLEQAMIDGGFGDWQPGGGFIFSSGPTKHPVTRSGREAAFTLAFRFRPGWQARFSHSRISRAHVRGYDADTYLFVRLTSRLYCESLVIAKRLGPIRVGAGPALYRSKVSHNPDGTQIGLGLITEGALTLPSRGRFFGDLAVVYRLLGSAEFGPFEVSDRANTLTVPRSETALSHVAVRIGIGVRF